MKVLTQTTLIRRFNVKRWLFGLALLLASLMVWVGAVHPAWAYTYDHEILVNADFAGRDLTDSNFTQSSLKASNFKGCNLRGVSFFSSNLEGSNFEGANLELATLDSSRLVGANLTNANLEGAYAINARFQGATIDGADFTDVELRSDMRAILCEVATGKNPTTGRQTRETLNCD